jgi:hypothetical protein
MAADHVHRITRHRLLLHHSFVSESESAALAAHYPVASADTVTVSVQAAVSICVAAYHGGSTGSLKGADRKPMPYPDTSIPGHPNRAFRRRLEGTELGFATLSWAQAPL